MFKPCILLIEDHKEYREAVLHFLELSNIKAHFLEASSGEEGVLLAKTKKPSIVIIDFSLGGIDGLEVSRQIKKYLPQCSIIMLSMYDPKEILRRNGHGNVSSFVNKSDLYEQLVPAINKILIDSKKNRKYLLSKKG